MKVLIFGAAGFIGSHLARQAAAAGHEVVCFCRSGRVPGFDGPCHPWSLGVFPAAAAVQGADCAMHLAHDFAGEPGAERTLTGTLAVLEALRRAGVRRQLLFSSYSAGPQATSIYGRVKSALEQRVMGMEDVLIVRPGLVKGDGGIHGRISRFVRLSPWVPLPDGGQGRVPVIEIGKLCDLTLALASSVTPAREHNLFEPALVTLRQIVQEAARAVGRHSVWVLPVPSSLVLLGLRLASVLRLPLPVNADNLSGFLANQDASHQSSLPEPAGSHPATGARRLS
jgi:nucleoside-diphosphate-sugar epimerase